jgi:hypothetical protein
MAEGPARPRDPRLDVLRGLALVMIFINHVPGNPLEMLTSRNFGFSDAAEGFVFIAGVAAGLAYGGFFRPGTRQPWQGAVRIGLRVWKLYLVHLFITLAAFAIVAGAVLWFGSTGMLHRNGIDMLFRRPFEALLGLPLLTYQLGYADILPLYVVLLAAAPVLIWVGWRWPGGLVAGSVLFWALSAHLRLNLPNAFGTGGWFFSPFAWQLPFVIGLLTGLALREGRRLVPVRPWALWLSAAVLVLALIWVTVPAVAGIMNHQLWRLQQAGVPPLITSFDKNYLYAPRLVHFLALAYLLSALPLVMRACASRRAAPLALLGRQGLPVFALASVLAYLFQAIKTETGINPPLDLAMVLAGLGLMLAFAALQDRMVMAPSPKAAKSPASSPRE